MALTLRWTNNAIEDYHQIIIYLSTNWPESVVEDFILNVESRVRTLSISPDIGISSIKQQGVKSIVLTKHNKLYYKTFDNFLYILNIFDTRQNPEKNKYG